VCARARVCVCVRKYSQLVRCTSHHKKTLCLRHQIFRTFSFCEIVLMSRIEFYNLFQCVFLLSITVIIRTSAFCDISRFPFKKLALLVSFWRMFKIESRELLLGEIFKLSRLFVARSCIIYLHTGRMWVPECVCVFISSNCCVYVMP